MMILIAIAMLIMDMQIIIVMLTTMMMMTMHLVQLCPFVQPFHLCRRERGVDRHNLIYSVNIILIIVVIIIIIATIIIVNDGNNEEGHPPLAATLPELIVKSSALGSHTLGVPTNFNLYHYDEEDNHVHDDDDDDDNLHLEGCKG